MDDTRNTFNINSLSEKELKEASSLIDERLKEIKDKREDKKRRKKQYALITPKPQYHTNYYKLWEIVKDTVNNGGAVNAGNIEEIYYKGQEQERIPMEDIYPCPECGAVGSLSVGEYGDHDSCWGTGKSKKRITCSRCSFVCTAKHQSNDWDAWEQFHDWLIRKGYLNPADPTASVQEMLDYGYTYKGMWPLHQEAAEKHYEAGLSVWRLYDDGTESSVMDLTDLREHAEKGGLFGIEKEEWEKQKKGEAEI